MLQELVSEYRFQDSQLGILSLYNPILAMISGQYWEQGHMGKRCSSGSQSPQLMVQGRSGLQIYISFIPNFS